MAEYDTVTVGAGDTFSKRLADGETWENVLIDISATGASYSILATGNNWTIRNIGIKGTFDSDTNPSDLNVYVPDSNSTGVIENLYMPGYGQKAHNYDGPEGIYVHPNHKGDLLIKRCNVQYMQDNGIYGSAPGNGSSHPNPGGNGAVRIEDCYGYGNATDHTRIGTDSSYVKNTCGWNGVHRGHWQYYHHSKLVDCDYGNNGSADINLGGNSWSTQSTAEVTAESSRWETAAVGGGQGINGQSVGTPKHRIPQGVPETPEQAASGEGGSSGGSVGGGVGPNGPKVTTGGTSDVTKTEGTVTADLTDLGSYDSVDVYFQWRPYDGGGSG